MTKNPEQHPSFTYRRGEKPASSEPKGGKSKAEPQLAARTPSRASPPPPAYLPQAPNPTADMYGQGAQPFSNPIRPHVYRARRDQGPVQAGYPPPLPPFQGNAPMNYAGPPVCNPACSSRVSPSLY
jgi:hypothetical protein